MVDTGLQYRSPLLYADWFVIVADDKHVGSFPRADIAPLLNTPRSYPHLQSTFGADLQLDTTCYSGICDIWRMVFNSLISGRSRLETE